MFMSIKLIVVDIDDQSNTLAPFVVCMESCDSIKLAIAILLLQWHQKIQLSKLKKHIPVIPPAENL